MPKVDPDVTMNAIPFFFFESALGFRPGLQVRRHVSPCLGTLVCTH